MLAKFVRISGVYVHTGTRRSKQLVLTEDGVVNNNKTIFYFLLLN